MITSPNHAIHHSVSSGLAWRVFVECLPLHHGCLEQDAASPSRYVQTGIRVVSQCHSVTVMLPKVLQRCYTLGAVTLSLNIRLWVTQGLELQALSRLHGKEGRNRVGGGGGEIEHNSYLRVLPSPPA